MRRVLGLQALKVLAVQAKKNDKTSESEVSSETLRTSQVMLPFGKIMS
jgi:hypothetical protein